MISFWSGNGTAGASSAAAAAAAVDSPDALREGDKADVETRRLDVGVVGSWKGPAPALLRRCGAEELDRLDVGEREEDGERG
jgi:hypothetical protein